MAVRTVVSILLAACLAGCGTDSKEVVTAGRVNHIVLCWLKEPGNTAHRQKIVEVSKSFREIPGVVEVRVGQVLASQREIVDDTFDVCISITFGSVEDMESYIAHPTHQEAVEEVLGPLVKKIVVYDFVDE